MKFNRKVVSLAISLLMIGSMAGCAKPATTGTAATPAKEETVAAKEETATAKEETVAPAASTDGLQQGITVQLLMPDEGITLYPEIFAATEKKLKADGLDFKLNVTSVPYGDFMKKLSLVVASKEDVDLTWLHIGWLATRAAEGVLAPLNEPLNKYGKNLVDNVPQFVWDGASVDGTIYTVPRFVGTADYNWMTAIRKDLREKYKVPEIKDIAGYEVYLDAIKKNEPNMLDYSQIREFNRVYTPTWHFLDSGTYVDINDPTLTVKNFYETPEYKTMCDIMYKWAENGWQAKDKKLFNDDDQAAFNSGRLASTGSNVFWVSEQVQKLSKQVPEGEIEDVIYNPDKPKYIRETFDNSMAVFSTSTKANESIAFLNWLHANQENYDLFTYGVKGENYNLVGDKTSYKDIAPEKKYVSLSWMWSDMRFMRFDERLSDEKINTIRTWNDGAIVSPLAAFQLDKSTYNDYSAAVTTVTDQYGKQVEFGLAKYDDVKADFLSKLKAAGQEEIIKDIQTQVNAYIAKHPIKK